LGEDVSNVLEYVPASFKVIQHVRPRFTCTCCDRMMQAPAPSRPIARGLAGPGLLAHVIVSKYADHTPLHRQSAIYAREGIELSDSTMADWVGASHQLLSPLVSALRDHVFAASKLHTMTRRCLCLCPARARPNRRGCGPMCVTTVRMAARPRPPSGIATRPTARTSIRRHI